VGDLILSDPQARALRAALTNHGIVVISRGFGRDRNVQHAIVGKVYVQLVMAGLLTPHDTRTPFRGEAIRVESGKAGYLTPAGEEAARALPAEPT
jgi:hypothetical protein